MRLEAGLWEMLTEPSSLRGTRDARVFKWMLAQKKFYCVGYTLLGWISVTWSWEGEDSGGWYFRLSLDPQFSFWVANCLQLMCVFAVVVFVCLFAFETISREVKGCCHQLYCYSWSTWVPRVLLWMRSHWCLSFTIKSRAHIDSLSLSLLNFWKMI